MEMTKDHRSVTFNRLQWMMIENALLFYGIAKSHTATDKNTMTLAKASLDLADEVGKSMEFFDQDVWITA